MSYSKLTVLPLAKYLTRFPGYLWVIGFVYLFALWWYAVPFTGDEKVYVSTVAEMWQRNSWLSPMLFGETSYYKPPFQFWSILLSWNLFGFGNFGTYFPSVVAVILTSAALALVQKRFTPDRTPLAAVWFAACAGTLTYGTTAQMEIWVVCFYLWFWVACFRFLDTQKWRALDAALLIAGISGLVKSPLYSAFSVLSFWMYLGFTRQLYYFSRLRFWLSHLYGILAGSLWFGVILRVDPERFWAGYVQRETLSKTGGNGATIAHMWGDFSTFFFPFILLAIPVIGSWLFLAIASLKRLPSFSRKQIFGEKPSIFLFSCLLIPGIFFHVFPYRTETYLYVLLPFLILALDWSLPETFQTAEISAGFFRWTARLNGVLILFGISLASFVFVRIGMVPQGLGLIFVLAATFLLFAFWRGQKVQMAFSSLFLIFAIRLCAASLGMDDIQTLKNTLASFPDRNLYFFDEGRSIWHEIGTLSVGVGKPSFRSESVPHAVEILKSGGLLVLNDTQIPTFFPQIRDAILQSPPSGQVKEISSIPWMRWKRGFTLPSPQELLDFGNRESPQWHARNQREFRILYLQ